MQKIEWITGGYRPWLKRQRKKHCKANYIRYLHLAWKRQGKDIDFVCTAGDQLRELFWQCELLMGAIGELAAAKRKEP